MKRLTIILSLLGVILMAGQAPAATERPNDTYKMLDLFGAVFERVRSSYVDKVEDEKLIEAAINGMLQSLDPHSSYMNAETFKEMQVQTEGKFGGLGIEVTMEEGLVRVVAPIDDTPAAKAGIQAGDLITHIDGTPVAGMTLRDAVGKMRGPVGTEITIRVRRGGEEPFDVKVTRAVITVQSVRYQTYGNIGYVRITSFTEQTEVGLRQALEAIKSDLGDRWAGTVLDLRNNPGGLLDQSIKVSDAFLDQGEIVSTRGRDSRINARFNAEKGDLSEGRPIVVLINGGSASASEIVAGALQDHRRAIVVGTRSFGKGSVQSIIPLSGNGAMRLTTARYYTPSGRSIQAKGIDPDIIVEQGKLARDASGPGRRESELPRALDNDKPESKPEKEPETKPEAEKKDEDKPDTARKDVAEDDYQLARALDLLRGIALYEAQRKGR